MTEHAAARQRRGRILGLFRHHRSGLFALAVLVGAGSGGAAVLFRLGIERSAAIHRLSQYIIQAQNYFRTLFF